MTALATLPAPYDADVAAYAAALDAAGKDAAAVPRNKTSMDRPIARNQQPTTKEQ